MKIINALNSAFKIKDLKRKILFTIMMVVLVRIGSQVPVPGIDTDYFKDWISRNTGDVFNILSSFSGGSFERFSIFALGITPFITASIITQLLTVVFPSLEEIRKDGEYGRRKMERINRYVAAALALFESTAMTIGFGRSGLLPGMTVLRGIIVVIFMTLGTAVLMLIAYFIDKKGIGNGTSIILAFNILSGIPSSIYAAFEVIVAGKNIPVAIAESLVFVGVLVLTVVAIVILNESVRKIPVQYSGKVGRGSMISQKSFIPVKVNVSNVIPVIFTSSVLSVPQMIAGITGKGYKNKITSFLLNSISQNNWFKKAHPEYTFGLVIYLAMVFFFAYFYASIAFNPMEVADTIKKRGGVIPGIRQGKPTEIYIKKIVERLVFIGATGLMIVVLIPNIVGSVLNVSLSFGGTSLIIVAGVILETLTDIESEMHTRNYTGILR